MLSHDFKAFNSKTGMMELGNDILFKLMELYIFKTDEIRLK
jgi:hypothetical protein